MLDITELSDEQWGLLEFAFGCIDRQDKSRWFDANESQDGTRAEFMVTLGLLRRSGKHLDAYAITTNGIIMWNGRFLGLW